jgi:cathepsin D
LLIQALLIISPDDAITLHSAIPSSITDGQGDFAFPCSTSAQLTVSFGGKSFNISPKDYVGQPLNGGNSLCQSNIVGQQVGVSNQWLMGDVFLKNVFSCFKEGWLWQVYTVFDYDNNQIGFGAKSTDGTSPAASDNQSFVAASGSGKLAIRGAKTLMYGVGSVVLSIIFLFWNKLLGSGDAS